MIHYRIDDSGARRKLKKAAAAAKHLPYEQIGRLLDESIDTNFASGGRYSHEDTVWGGSKTWEALKHSTRRPLEKTGRLRRSISYRVHGDTVELYSSDNIANLYASAQNYGYPPRNIPARPFMVIQQDDDQRLEDILAKHFGV